MKTPIKLLAAGFWLAGIVSALSADLRVGLVAYWPLDVDTSGTTPDMAAYGNPMTEFNAPSIVPGQFDNAFSFNGTNQNLAITHAFDNSASGLPVYTSAKGYTVAMWVKGAGQTSKYLFSEGNTLTTTPIFIIQTANVANTNTHLDIIIRSSGNVIPVNHIKSTSVVFDNTWHHIAWVDDHGDVKLYVDGNLDGTNFKYAWPGLFVFNTTAIGALVRSDGTTGYFNGLIDDVALWERPLSQDEVNQMRTNSLVIPATPTILTQPVGSTNAPGRRVAVSVGVVGTPPMTFQWSKDGTAVDGATTRMLVLTNLTSAATNNFTVQVSNGGTPVTSNPARVVTLPDPASDLRNGLVSYWPFDTVVATATTTNSPDIYYLGTDMVLLTNLDSSSLVPGQYSNALSFALNQYGRRLGGTPIYTTTNYTVSFWVQGGSGQANKQVFAEGGTIGAVTNGDYFLLGTENPTGGGLLDVKSSASPWLNDAKSKQVVFDGAWHHVVWVDENGAARLYVDGVVDANDFTYYRSNLVLNSTAVAALYRVGPANFFFGSVDELALWSRALTWTEIQQVRTNGVPLPQAGIPVTITTQPQGSTNRLGDRINLLVTATGSLPLSYQWLKDNVPITGETNNVLTLFLTATATNNYSVRITNITGPANSTLARVVVLPDPAPDLSANLLNDWPLNTATASPNATSPDQASHNDLALNGLDNNNLVPGHFGNALSFSGGQYAQRTGGFPAAMLSNYTVSVWVNGSIQAAAEVYAEGSTSSDTPLFMIGTDTSGASPAADIFLRTDAGTVQINHRLTTRPLFDGTWHHLVWVDQNGQARVFVDGVLDETSFAYNRGTLTLDTTALGGLVRAATGNFYAGAIDDVAVWGRALSWTEIQQIQTAAVPAPSAPVPLAILSQPVNVTNYYFASSTFSVLAQGAGPVSYQWRKDGANIPASGNPTATNATLILSGVKAPSAAGGYSVFITNASGSVTSSVAQLVLINDSLRVDCDANGTANIQPGFVQLTLGAPGISVGGISVSVSALGGIALADRLRNAAPFVSDNPPLLTQSQLYNDFIFGNNNTTPGVGMNVLVEHLAPDTKYGVTLWSFDRQSGGARVSDWTEVASGPSIPIATGYTFDGNVPPTADYEYTIGGLLTSSPQGRLQFQGVSAGTNFTVFVNALRIEANPTPTSRIVGASITNATITLLAVGQYPRQPISFEQNTNIVGGAWIPAIGATPLFTNGMVLSVQFPATETQLFYRAVSPMIQ